MFKEVERKKGEGSGGPVLASFLLLTFTILLSGTYFKQQLARRSVPVDTPRHDNKTNGIHPVSDTTSTLPVHTIPDSTELICVDSAAIRAKDSVMMLVDAARMPSNKTLKITSVDPNDPTIRFEAHRFRGAHWITGRYAVTNTSDTAVYFPYNRRATVEFDLNRFVLLNHAGASSKLFDFNILSTDYTVMMLPAHETREISMRCNINKQTFDYLKDAYEKATDAERKLRIDMDMTNQGATLKINRLAHWDMYFH